MAIKPPRFSGALSGIMELAAILFAVVIALLIRGPVLISDYIAWIEERGRFSEEHNQYMQSKSYRTSEHVSIRMLGYYIDFYEKLSFLIIKSIPLLAVILAILVVGFAAYEIFTA